MMIIRKIDNIKTSKSRNLFSNDDFLLGRDSYSSIIDGIQKQIKVYDHFQGFILSHSTFGAFLN